MTNIKIPGVLWTVLIVTIVALAHIYLDNPILVDGIVVIAFAVLKSMNLGTDELEQLLEIIKRYQAQATRSRAEAGTISSSAPIPVIETEAYEPNKPVRWLLG